MFWLFLAGIWNKFNPYKFYQFVKISDNKFDIYVRAIYWLVMKDDTHRQNKWIYGKT